MRARCRTRDADWHCAGRITAGSTGNPRQHDRQSYAPLSKDAAVTLTQSLITDNALKLGLSANIVRTGASDGVMHIAPPLTATEGKIDLGLDLLDAALDQTLENLPRVRAAE
jgi:hypothetical protein